MPCSYRLTTKQLSQESAGKMWREFYRSIRSSSVVIRCLEKDYVEVARKHNTWGVLETFKSIWELSKWAPNVLTDKSSREYAQRYKNLQERRLKVHLKSINVTLPLFFCNHLPINFQMMFFNQKKNDLYIQRYMMPVHFLNKKCLF